MAFAEQHEGHNGNGNGGGPANQLDILLRSLEARYEARVSHVDQRVGRVEQAIAGITSSMESVERTLSDISKKVHNPPQTQWSAIIAFASLVLAAGMAYTTLTIGPVQKQLDKVIDRQNDYRSQELDRLESYSLKLGEYSARMRLAEERLSEHATQDISLERRIDELNYKLGVNEGSHISLQKP